MFKLEATDITYFLKSYDIIDLWKFIVTNPDFNYEFHLDYDLISNNEFLKLFLQETKSYPDYIRLYQALKPLINDKDLLK